jgi:hypothetical protein
MSGFFTLFFSGSLQNGITKVAITEINNSVTRMLKKYESKIIRVNEVKKYLDKGILYSEDNPFLYFDDEVDLNALSYYYQATANDKPKGQQPCCGMFCFTPGKITSTEISDHIEYSNFSNLEFNKHGICIGEISIENNNFVGFEFDTKDKKSILILAPDKAKQIIDVDDEIFFLKYLKHNENQTVFTLYEI